MRGAVAAGHPLTAQAGADVLASGGNAVDACVAAVLVSWVAESPLTSPGGGGFMLVHRGCDRSTRVYDFFVAVPGLGRRRRDPEPTTEVVVDFVDSSSQVFHIGTGSCAVPGAAAGLAAAHAAHGSLPWRELCAQAAALARAGVRLTREQAFLHEILDPVLRHGEEGRRVYGGEAGLREGDLLRLPDLAASLDLLGAQGARAIYGGELGRELVRCVPGITAADLRNYRAVRRRPVRARYRGHELRSNPPPSSGGVLVAYGLALLDRAGEPDAAALVDVLRAQGRLRAEPEFGRRLHRGGLARWLAGRPPARAAAPEPPALAGTTHVSVLDAAGNAASCSLSTGSGSGVVVPGTGIAMNNMLGEADLLGGPQTPGSRLTSMMAPSLVLGPDGPRLVVGSAGSERLRGAIMQVVVNVVGRELPVREAIARPRLHVAGGQVHLEGGFDRGEAAALAARGDDVVRWRRRNLYFGGAAGVERRPDGSLAAAGDARRGGRGIVVA